jgi:hypothetical protein
MAVGLTQYSAALVVNKRFANIPEGAPIFQFNWAEDSIMRERMFVLPEQQAGPRASSEDAAGRRPARQTNNGLVHVNCRGGAPPPEPALLADGGSAMFLLRFLLIRCLAAIPVLFVISVVTFAIIQAPEGDYGDYIRSMLMNQGGTSAEVAEAQAQIYRERHGLNDPLVFQYLNWMWGIVTRFDFGNPSTSTSPWPTSCPSGCHARSCWR